MSIVDSRACAFVFLGGGHPTQLLPSRRSARPKSAAGGFRALRTFVEVSLSQVTPGHAPRCLHFSGMSRAVFEFLRFLAPGRKAFGLWPGEGARRRFCLGGTARSPSRQLNCVTHQVLKQHFGFKSCRAQRPVQMGWGVNALSELRACRRHCLCHCRCHCRRHHLETAPIIRTPACSLSRLEDFTSSPTW